MAKKDYMDILLEQVIDQNKAVLEAVTDLHRKVKKIDGIEKDVSEIKQDVKTIKVAVTDLSKQVQNHEFRITTIEAVA